MRPGADFAKPVVIGMRSEQGGYGPVWDRRVRKEGKGVGVVVEDMSGLGGDICLSAEIPM